MAIIRGLAVLVLIAATGFVAVLFYVVFPTLRIPAAILLAAFAGSFVAISLFRREWPCGDQFNSHVGEAKQRWIESQDAGLLRATLLASSRTAGIAFAIWALVKLMTSR